MIAGMDLTSRALDCLLVCRWADVAVARDWELLRELARLADEGPPVDLARTDPKLFERWRDAVTRYHLGGWTKMTPTRVDAVTSLHGYKIGL